MSTPNAAPMIDVEKLNVFMGKAVGDMLTNNGRHIGRTYFRNYSMTATTSCARADSGRRIDARAIACFTTRGGRGSCAAAVFREA